MNALQTFVIILVATASALGQGTVDFRNGGVSFPTVADRRVYGPVPGGGCGPLVGTNYVAGLFYVPGANANIYDPTLGTQAGELARFRAPTTAAPGLWLNPVAVGNTRVLDGVTFGQTATLQVRVWDITRYPTYQAAFAAGSYAVSAPFNYTVPSADNIDPSKYYMDNLRAFGPPLEACVPEPTTVSLLALGGLAWLWLRRKRGA